MKIVRISDLSEEKKKKVNQRIQEQVQTRASIGNSDIDLIDEFLTTQAEKKRQETLVETAPTQTQNKRQQIASSILTNNSNTNSFDLFSKLINDKTTAGQAKAKEQEVERDELNNLFAPVETDSSDILMDKALRQKAEIEAKQESEEYSKALLNRDESILRKVEETGEIEETEKNTNILQDISGLGKIGAYSAKASTEEIANYMLAPTYANTTIRQKYETFDKTNLNKTNEINDIEKAAGYTLGTKRLTGSKALQNLIQRDNGVTQEEQSKLSNPVTEQLGYVAQGLGQMTPGAIASIINPYLGTIAFTTSAGGSYYDEAISRGMNNKNAFKYATIMGSLEGITEQVITGSALSTVKKGITGAGLSKEVLESFGMNTLEEFGQEAIMEPAQELTAQVTGGSKSSDWSDMGERMLQAGFTGALMGIVAGGAGSGLIKSVEVYNNIRNGKSVTTEQMKGAIQENIREFGEKTIKQRLQEGAKETYGQLQSIDYTLDNQENMQVQQLQSEKIQLKNELANTPELALQATLQQQIEQIDKQINELAPVGQTIIENKTVSQQGQITQQENKTAQNKNSNQKYQYKATDNEKINNLRQDMSKYWNNSEEAKTLGKTIEKVITDKNYNVRLDDTIINPKGKSVDAQITTLDNGEVEIRINPNSKRAGEFLLTHEITHAIETQEIRELIIDHAGKNEEFNQALEDLKQTYGVDDVSDEVVADISGQLLGNQEFINSLSMEKPSIFKKIYNKIIEWANKITGNSNEALFLKDLKNKWAEAYRTQENNLSKSTQYSIQTDKNGNKYVKVDTSQDIFEGKSNKEQERIAKQYILDNFREKGINFNEENAKVTSKTASEYTHPKNKLPESTKSSKMKASTELDNLLKVSKYQYSSKDDGRHKFAQDGWDYYKTNFEVNGIMFEGMINIAKSGFKKTLYDVTKIKRISQNRSASDNSFSTSLTNSNNIIPSSNKNVNTTKYSMQKVENNAIKINKDSVATYTDIDGKEKNIFFRFDNENTFRGKEHESGISMWEDRIDDMLSPNYDMYEDLDGNIDFERAESEVDDILEKYDTNYEEYEQMSDGKKLQIKRKIALDEGYITKGASCFELSEESMDEDTRNYIDNYLDGYKKVNFFTGERNGWGADGETVVIPDKLLVTIDSNQFNEILYDEILEDLTDEQKLSKIVDMLNKRVNKDTLYSSDVRYSQEDTKWKEHLEENYKSTGTKTNLEDIRITKAVEEAIVPLQETIKELREQITPVQKEVPIEEIPKDDLDALVSDLNTIEKNENTIYKDTSYKDSNRLMNDLVRFTKQEAGKTSKLAGDTIAPVVETKTEDNAKGNLKEAWQVLRRLTTNRNAIIDDFSKQTGNKDIKYIADRVNNIVNEVSGDINTAQTDNNGNPIGKSLKELFDWAREKDLYDDFNNYLIHRANTERAAVNKGLLGYDAQQSQEVVEAYEKTYPEFEEHAKEVNQYAKNLLQNAVNGGRYTQGFADLLSNELYQNYVPFYGNQEANPYNVTVEDITSRNTIKRAKGGANIDTLNAIENALEKQTFQYKSAIAENNLYKEIVNTIKKQKGTIKDTENLRYINEDTENFMTDKQGNKYLTAFENGEPITVKISEELFNNLNDQVQQQLKQIESSINVLAKPLQIANTIYGKMLTTWSLTFPMVNAIKDIQDATLNSKYTTDFLNYYFTGKTMKDIKNNSAEWQQFKTLYGTNASEAQAGISYTKINIGNRSKFLRVVSTLNELIELIPRYTEYKVSLDNGASVNEALYNAREVTTNFGRGGIVTKALNRNGATFLNASVQGFSKFIRNFSEAYTEQGATGVAKMFAKATMLGIVPAVLNHMLFGSGDDDEEYNAIPDYIKDNYYLIKYNDNSFIRIPKGRMLSIFGSAARRTLEYAEGEEEAFEGWLTNAWSQSGANNPLEDNLFSGLIQAASGKTWYGTDLIPTRLEDELPQNQYDEKIDKFSIWLGKQAGISPYKINYILQQYGGSIADIVLPMITPETKTANDDNLLGILTSLFEDKFTANSTFDNKYASEFYELKDNLTKIANDSNATDEDNLKSEFINDISSELSELYKEKREVQINETMSNSEKYNKVSTIQLQINQIAYDALTNYENVDKYSNYATVGGKEYYLKNKDNGTQEWSSISDELSEKIDILGLNNKEKNAYLRTYASLSKIKNNENIDTITKKEEITNKIINTELDDDAKESIYKSFYNNDESYQYITNANISFDEYANAVVKIAKIKNEYANTDDMNSKEKTAMQSARKEAVQQYIQSLPLDVGQKLILEKIVGGYSVKNSQTYLQQYIQSLPLTKEEKQALDKKVFN